MALAPETRKALLAKLQTQSRKALYAIPQGGGDKPYQPKGNLVDRLEEQLGLTYREVCSELALIRYEFLLDSGVSEERAKRLSGWDMYDPNRKRLLPD